MPYSEQRLSVMRNIGGIKTTWRIGIAPFQVIVESLVCWIPKSNKTVVVKKAEETDRMQIIGTAVNLPENFSQTSVRETSEASLDGGQSKQNLSTLDVAMDLETAYALLT